MRLLAATVIALGAIATTPTASDAKCAFQQISPRVLNADGELPARDGRVVIGGESDVGDSPGAPETLAWKVGTTTAKLDVLAPGLIAVTGDGTAGRRELTRDGAAPTAVTWGSREPRTVPAPRASMIRQHITSQGRRRSLRLVAELGADAPADALALIVYDATTNAPRSWGRASKRTVNVYARNGCSVVPDGTVLSQPGDRVVLRWVDRFGRLSPPSKVVVIQPTKDATLGRKY